MQVTKQLAVMVAASALVLGGCQTTKETQGQVIGAIAGGILGNQVGSGSGRTAAVIAGTLLGGFVGGNVGRQMDDGDRYRAGQALEATPTYQSSRWQNPDSGNRYAVTPTKTYYDGSRPCRDYTTEAWIDGQRETITGSACRQSDGTWRASN